MFNLNISIIEYCGNAIKEMEKIPTRWLTYKTSR
jgi:hypothetical protein